MLVATGKVKRLDDNQYEASDKLNIHTLLITLNVHGLSGSIDISDDTKTHLITITEIENER